MASWGQTELEKHRTAGLGGTQEKSDLQGYISSVVQNARFLFKTTYFQQLVLLSNWHHLLFFLKLNIFNIFSSSLFVLSHCRIGWEKQTLCPTLKAILSRKFSPLNKFAYYSSKQSHLSSQKTDWKRSEFLSEYTKCVL